jgi:RNA-directed DNA polymerase
MPPKNTDLIQRMAFGLGIRFSDSEEIFRSAPYRYRFFKIPKKRSTEKIPTEKNIAYRIIAQPAEPVKMAQKWVVSEYLARLPVHPSATAYRPSKSIVDNVKPHINNSVIEKFDFRDFFGSIQAEDFFIYMANVSKGLLEPLSENDVWLLSNLMFCRIYRDPDTEEAEALPLAKLVVGAPSSPALSNVLLYEFDSKIDNFCRENGVAYTRYADDLTFSYNQLPPVSIEDCILQVLKEIKCPRSLKLNPDKYFRGTSNGVRKVTGIVITSDGRITVGRARKRRLRAALKKHFIDIAKEDVDVTRLRQLLGWLAFCKHVEPDYVKALEKYYGIDNVMMAVKNAIPTPACVSGVKTPLLLKRYKHFDPPMRPRPRRRIIDSLGPEELGWDDDGCGRYGDVWEWE